MNSEPSERSEQRAPLSSESGLIRLEVFECGDGDTLLLRIADKWWVLIDCHLTKRTHDRFFTLVKKLGIECLDVLCLSHPDRDHFHGMLDVVKYFTAGKRSIKYYCDSGVDPKQIRDLLKKRDEEEASEYESLHRNLDRLFDADQVTYRPVDENSSAIQFEWGGGSAELVPIGPQPRMVRKLQRLAAKTGRVSKSLNAISSVFVLRVMGGHARINVLLAGDAEAAPDGDRPSGLDRGLDIWRRQCAEGAADDQFAIVKIPHHGALNGLSRTLTRMRARAPAVAVLSVGEKFRTHPDRAVLKAYSDEGWTILCTCCRREVPPPDSPLDLFADTPVAFEHHSVRTDVSITCDVNGKLDWEPKNCAIDKGEHHLYESGE